MCDLERGVRRMACMHCSASSVVATHLHRLCRVGTNASECKLGSCDTHALEHGLTVVGCRL